MFYKKLLLEVPTPKIPKLNKNQILSIVAKIYKVKDVDTLVIDFFKENHIARIFFQGENYINYEIENESFNKKILADFNYKNYGCYILEIYNSGRFKIDKDSETLLLKYFGLTLNSSLRSLFEKIQNVQYKQQRAKEEKAAISKHEKYERAKELLGKIEIPKLSMSREDAAKLKLTDKKLYVYEENGCTNYYCPTCGETIELDNYTAKYYETEICESCGCKIFGIKPVYKIKTYDQVRYVTQTAYVTKLYAQNGIAFSVSYLFSRTVKFIKKGKRFSDGFKIIENEEFIPSELHIFDNGQSFTFAKFEALDMWNKTYTDDWIYKDKFTVYNYFGTLLPINIDDFKGTAIANSKVDIILEQYKSEKFNSNLVQKIINYLDFYCLRPNIENLVTAGYLKLAADAPLNRKEALAALNFKRPKMVELTGLEKTEREKALQEQWNFEQIKIYKKVKYMEKILNFNQISSLSKILGVASKKQYKTIMQNLQLIKYLLKQSEKEKSVITTIYFDYLDMAKQLDYDFSNEKVQFPPHLLNAHDSLMRKTKYKPNSERNKKYELLKSKIQEYEFSLNDLCLKIPDSDYDLYLEGKLLDHCVGGEGYMFGHTEGRCIFFIRNSSTPTVPLYTLNFNIKTGQQIQLHGYNNERNGQIIPQEIYDFIAYWKENIFRRFNVDNMEFIDKPKKKKTSAA